MESARVSPGGGPGGADAGGGAGGGGGAAGGGAGGRRASGGRGGGNAIADKISMAGAKAVWSHEGRGPVRSTARARARRSFPPRRGRNAARHGRAGGLFGRRRGVHGRPAEARARRRGDHRRRE